MNLFAKGDTLLVSAALLA